MRIRLNSLEEAEKFLEGKGYRVEFLEERLAPISALGRLLYYREAKLSKLFNRTEKLYAIYGRNKEDKGYMIVKKTHVEIKLFE